MLLFESPKNAFSKGIIYEAINILIQDFRNCIKRIKSESLFTLEFYA